MKQKLIRAGVAFVLALTAGGVGYSAGGSGGGVAGTCVNIPAQTVTAPASGTVRVVYSLDQKQNDKEIIALIDAARVIFILQSTRSHSHLSPMLSSLLRSAV